MRHEYFVITHPNPTRHEIDDVINSLNKDHEFEGKNWELISMAYGLYRHGEEGSSTENCYVMTFKSRVDE